MSFNKPASLIDWMPSNTVEVPSEKATTGWIAGEEPAFQYFNAIFQNFSAWHKFVNNNFPVWDDNNKGIGELSLSGATGSGNLAFGTLSGASIGASNFTLSIGLSSNQNAVGDDNVAIGRNANGAVTSFTKSSNTAIGSRAGFGANANNLTIIGKDSAFLSGRYIDGLTSIGRSAFSHWANTDGVGGFPNTASGHTVIGDMALSQPEGAGNKLQIGGIHIGQSAGRMSNVTGATIGAYRIAIGNTAALDTSGGNYAIFMGFGAGRESTGNSRTVAIGNESARESIGDFGTYLGNRAGRGQLGNSVIAIGNHAATNDDDVLVAQSNGSGIFIGNFSGSSSSLTSVIALGTNSGRLASGARNVFIGSSCGFQASGSDIIAIGGIVSGSSPSYTGSVLGGSHSIYIGTGAGHEATGSYVSALGYRAGLRAEANYVVAIGDGAGVGVKSANADTIAIGRGAGSTGVGVAFGGTAIFIGKDQGKNLDQTSGTIEDNPFRLGMNTTGSSLLHGSMDSSGNVQNQYLRVNGMFQVREMTTAELTAWQSKFTGAFRSGMVALNITTNQLWVSSFNAGEPAWLKFTPAAIDAW